MTKLFVGSGCESAEDQERQPADERGEDHDLDEARVFEAVEEFVASPAAALLFGSETAANRRPRLRKSNIGLPNSDFDDDGCPFRAIGVAGKP